MIFFRDAILVCLADLFTGFFAGFVIFSVIGHVSYRTGIPIENFNQSGEFYVMIDSSETKGSFHKSNIIEKVFSTMHNTLLYSLTNLDFRTAVVMLFIGSIRFIKL